MRAIIVVNMDGPAFGVSQGNKGCELARVLHEYAERLRFNGVLSGGTLKLYDSSGATCGRLTVSK